MAWGSHPSTVEAPDGISFKAAENYFQRLFFYLRYRMLFIKGMLKSARTAASTPTLNQTPKYAENKASTTSHT